MRCWKKAILWTLLGPEENIVAKEERIESNILIVFKLLLESVVERDDKAFANVCEPLLSMCPNLMLEGRRESPNQEPEEILAITVWKSETILEENRELKGTSKITTLNVRKKKRKICLVIMIIMIMIPH